MGSPRIITFYSFRGGVGRTSALQNVAALLSASGRRVLVVDFDLTSPGLTLLLQKSESQTLSVLQLLMESTTQSQFPYWFRAASSVSKGMSLRAWDEIEAARFNFLPAGPYSEERYNELLGELDSRRDALKEATPGIVKALRKELEDLQEYDYVLIDSRTELNDESLLCAGGLADYLIVVTGLSPQHMEGTARAVRTLVGRGAQFTKAQLVFSPVPTHHYDALGALLEQASNDLHIRLAEHLGQLDPLFLEPRRFLTLSYDASASFEDGLFLTNHWDSPLAHDYRRLHMRIRELCKDGPAELARDQDRSLRSHDYAKVKTLLEARRGLDMLDGDVGKSHFAAYVRHLSSFLFFRPTGELLAATELLKYLTRVDPECHYNPWSLARLGVSHARGALSYWDEAAQKATAEGNLLDAQIVKMEAGQQEERWGMGVLPGAQSRPVRENLESMLELQLPPSANMGLALTYHNLAEVARLDGDYPNQERYLLLALDIHKLMHESLREATAHHSLGLSKRLTGRYTEALSHLEAALKIYEDQRSSRSASIVRHSLGELLRLRGDFEGAREQLSEAEKQRDKGELLGKLIILLSSGAVAYDMADYKGAIKLLGEARRVFPQEDANVEQRLVTVYLEAATCQNEPTTGTARLERAVQECQRPRNTANSRQVSRDWTLRSLLVLADALLTRPGNSHEMVSVLDDMISEASALDLRSIAADACAYRFLFSASRKDAIERESPNLEAALRFYQEENVHNRPARLLKERGLL